MYGTIADWRSYALARGDSAPADATDADATAALTRGSDMIRLRYMPNLLPGYGVDFVPPGSDLPLVEEAAYSAASIELSKPGLFSKTYTAAEQKVLTEVKGIKWTVTEYPTVSIEPFDGRWVVAPLDGKAKVEALQQNLFTGAWYPLSEEVDFSFTTRLDVSGDTVKVTPVLSF